MLKKLFPLTLVCLSLSACSTLTSPFSSGAAPSADTVAPYREQVELTGRLNVVYQKGDKAEAQKLWREAQGKDPKNEALKSTLARLNVSL